MSGDAYKGIPYLLLGGGGLHKDGLKSGKEGSL